jgi:uncharacterized protein (TIGR01655 family)
MNNKEVFILKKKLIWFSVVLIIAVAGIKIAWGYFGLHDYYVSITENGKLQTGEIVGIGPYEYNQKAYDKEGNEISVIFQTKKNLELNTFLHVEVLKPNKDKVNGVNRLEKVTAEQVPEEVKEKLKVNQ